MIHKFHRNYIIIYLLFFTFSATANHHMRPVSSWPPSRLAALANSDQKVDPYAALGVLLTRQPTDSLSKLELNAKLSAPIKINSTSLLPSSNNPSQKISYDTDRPTTSPKTGMAWNGMHNSFSALQPWPINNAK